MAFRELDYQTRALDALDGYLAALSGEKAKADKVAAIIADNPGLGLTVPDFPGATWMSLASEGKLPVQRAALPYSPRQTGDGQPVPNITLKVPTGGGKTYLACAALSRIFGRYLSTNHGFVLWIVPNEAIYTQTLKALRDRQHPYRQTLDRAAAGRVKVMEKTDPFNRADVDANLCVMVLMLQSSNRENQDSLRLFRDRGDVHGFTPGEGEQAAHAALAAAISNLSLYDLGDGGPQWPMVKDSVGNALRIIRPVVVMDEGQKAVSDLAFRTLYGFNPLFVLELTATPKDVKPKAATSKAAAVPGRTANILVDITGRELEREGMIKMPMNIAAMADTEWQATLRASLAKLTDLNTAAAAFRGDGGAYIRPILLVQVERISADQRDSGHIHADDAFAFLKAAGLDDDEIAYKTAERNDLDKPENRDLLSPACRVRAIITSRALAEGWDCPFAYILCALAANGNEAAMAQLVGRILRQPHATKTGVDALDECYVFTHRADTAAAVQAIRTGLQNDGLGDLARDVVLAGTGGDVKVRRRIQRRDTLRTTDIALPRVMTIEPDGSARLLDAETDLFPAIDWTGCDLTAFADALPDNAVAADAQLVRLHTAETSGLEMQAAQRIDADLEFDAAYAVRMIGDLVPNPFAARDLVEQVLARLAARGWDDALVGRLSGFIVDEMRKRLADWRDGQAAAIFRARLDSGAIEFRVRGDDGDWIAPDHEWTTSEADAAQLHASNGGPLQHSLFLPIYAADLNPDERKVAIYLDDLSVLRWWHRNGTERGSYALRGWRRGNVYPDFLFAALVDGAGERTIALESKGDQLAGNLDTAYKASLLETLTATYGDRASSPVGKLDLKRSAPDYNAAVVLFSDYKAAIPMMLQPSIAEQE